MLPLVGRHRLPKTELTYEYKESFEEVVGADFRYCTMGSSRRRKQRLDEMRDVGCRSIEPGDLVLVKDRWRKAKRTGATHKGVVGRVLNVASSAEHPSGAVPGQPSLHGNTTLTVTIENGEVLSTEQFDMEACARQPEVYSAWFPEGPPLENVQGVLGFLPDRPAFKHRSSLIEKKRKWGGEATAKYEGSNLSLIAKCLAQACAGDTGLISKYKLEAALVDADVVPPNAHQRRLLLTKIFDAGARAYMKEITLDVDMISPDNPSGIEEVVVYSELMGCIDSVVNGPGAKEFASVCFSMYAYSGYIDRESLREGRKLRTADRLPLRERGFCSLQVKTLLQIFDQVRKTQVEEFLSGGGGKKGKKKGVDPAAAAAGVPKTLTLKRHLSLGEFTQHIAADPQLALAFLPVCFDTLYEDSHGIKRFVPSARTKVPDRTLDRTHSEFFVTLGSNIGDLQQ
eukprot:TRINITY_DN13558_c0_g1_i1.p1 TRINITY_DN13558_c0_g1~~TRINITY_DN13558_c0_g1_i1.p1  ORF type:complete len:455 (+),score=175.86 TRINITY_DN13558_c0_g1_i1:128-1492(+)